jgi:hypothetical protein
MQHAHPEKPGGNKPVAIEVDGEPLGVVVREDTGFRFLAVRYNAFAIDGQVFPSVEAAREAVSEAVGGFRAD